MQNEQALREALVAAGRRLISENLTSGTSGNISVCDREGGYMLITPSGVDYAACTPADMVALRLEDGLPLCEGQLRPSIEAELHRGVYLLRPDVQAVLHTHPINSTVFSVIGEEIPLITDAAVQELRAPVRTAVYYPPGTAELAAAAQAALGEKARACLLKAHGAVCVGKSLPQTFDVAKVLENTAEIYWRIRALGLQPQPIADEHIRYMHEVLSNNYGQKK